MTVKIEMEMPKKYILAKDKGVSVADLCLRHNDITSNFQKIDGDIKFWVEVK